MFNRSIVASRDTSTSARKAVARLLLRKYQEATFKEFVMERDTLHVFLPLKLTSTAGREGVVVGSVEDAARELLTEWPDDGGDKFYEAVKACLDCLNEAVGPDSARMAFVQAAWEVGIQIEQ